MQAAQTFVNIAQLTMRDIMKLGISQPPHYPIAEVLFRCHFRWK